ncbi:hypothetical protein F5Y04DRAFT_279810 [Hypomontagnella monticulosa]|nr:hypothetical protein F5Y04DRAFT_279810 [Hypomontagnella monticulosa]
MDKGVFPTSCILFPLSLLAVSLRLHSRKLTRAGIGWDDGLIVAAALLEVVLFGLSIYIWDTGYGRICLEELGLDRPSILSLLLAYEAFYLVCMCLTKLSALYLYMRIFISKRFRTLCKVLGVITILLYLAVLVEAFTISEIAVSLWDTTNIGSLTDKKKVDIGIATFNILGNVIILILPLRPIWKLQMRIRTKICLTVLFSLGLCVVIISCVRLTAVIHATEEVQELIASGSRDMPFHLLECELAIFIICLPVLRPLWVKLRERCGSTRGERRRRMSESGLHRGDYEHALRKSENDEQGVGSHYNIVIRAGTPSLQGSPGQSNSPHDRTHIRVDRTWGVSYDTSPNTL